LPVSSGREFGNRKFSCKTPERNGSLKEGLSLKKRRNKKTCSKKTNEGENRISVLEEAFKKKGHLMRRRGETPCSPF